MKFLACVLSQPLRDAQRIMRCGCNGPMGVLLMMAGGPPHATNLSRSRAVRQGTAMSNFLDIALRCAVRGWKVLPCKPGDKAPIVAHGFHDASADVEQITAWWTRTPSANVGIACGASGLAVLDIDHGLTDEASFHAWRKAGGLPDTYTVRPGRRPDFGGQSSFAGPVPDVGFFELNGCSGQVKSLGGYVMAEGCLHPSGQTYQA